MLGAGSRTRCRVARGVVARVQHSETDRPLPLSPPPSQPWQQITAAKTTDYLARKDEYAKGQGSPEAAAAAGEVVATEAQAEPKKRSRKSEASGAAASADIPVEAPKKKEKAKATPVKKAATPVSRLAGSP